MLIRFATAQDISAWTALNAALSPVFPNFSDYAQQKIMHYEALTALDYRTATPMGFIGFSRKDNHIDWFAVAEAYRHKDIAPRLLKTALRQLEHTRLITIAASSEGAAQTLDLSHEQRGGSFHYRYPHFMQESQQEYCPVCNNLSQPDEQTDIAELAHTWATAEYPGQGRLFGKMYVMPKLHVNHFDDMPAADMIGFMQEAQRVSKALREVTGAVKINYEMHANSGAHLHIHLFPRYFDDDFPSKPIEYRLREPAPYEDYDEFLWFIKQMRQALGVA